MPEAIPGTIPGAIIVINPNSTEAVTRAMDDGLGRLRFHVRDELKRTWGRETRLDMANKGSKEITTPQLTGKYAARS